MSNNTTPRPWKWFRNYHCPSELKGAFIDDVAGTARLVDVLAHGGVGTQETCEANAELIVRAVNTFDQVREALETIEAVSMLTCDPLAYLDEIHSRAQAALAAMNGT